jgi:hypothetical protein
MANVTDYLERARECTAMADRKTGAEKERFMDLAEAWLKLADEQATLQSVNHGKSPELPPASRGLRR